MMGDVKHVISLGGGVQSSCMALMSRHQEFEDMPIAAVFADTGNEPESVYEWLDQIERLLPFPLYRVSRKMRDGSTPSLAEESLRMRVTRDGRKYSQTNIPFFTKNADGSLGMIPHRSCTSDFKIKPIQKFVRQHCGVKRGESKTVVHQWIGISLDELKRIKPSGKPWCKNVYPLIDKRMTRQDCERWLYDHGYPIPPKSACVFCPFHSDSEWRRIKADEPESFEKAVEFERAIQRAKRNSSNFRSIPYLHSSRKPLNEVDFRSDIERGQLTLFDDECYGMCGV